MQRSSSSGDNIMMIMAMLTGENYDDDVNGGDEGENFKKASQEHRKKRKNDARDISSPETHCRVSWCSPAL